MNEEDKAILYIALINSVSLYIESLEEDNLNPEDRELTEHLIVHHMKLIDQFAEELGEYKPIEKPLWIENQR